MISIQVQTSYFFFICTLTYTLALVHMPSSDRISRETQASFCSICNRSFESARAARNHRRYCAVHEQDVEMEESPSLPATSYQQHASSLVTETQSSNLREEEDTVMEEEIEEMLGAAEYYDMSSDTFEMQEDVDAPDSSNNGKQP